MMAATEDRPGGRIMIVAKTAIATAIPPGAQITTDATMTAGGTTTGATMTRAATTAGAAATAVAIRPWNRNDWRRDNRYDWQRYRDRNRGIYRPGRYYAPYSGYAYRRVSIGFSLGSMFYGNRYWINDPWQYRLPPVYGPYRWIRYYDDVMLVDIYSGQVVDVIYDFFW